VCCFLILDVGMCVHVSKRDSVCVGECVRVCACVCNSVMCGVCMRVCGRVREKQSEIFLVRVRE